MIEIVIAKVNFVYLYVTKNTITNFVWYPAYLDYHYCRLFDIRWRDDNSLSEDSNINNVCDSIQCISYVYTIENFVVLYWKFLYLIHEVKIINYDYIGFILLLSHSVQISNQLEKYTFTRFCI